MPLDTRIPLMAQPIQMPDFNALAGQRMDMMRNAMAMQAEQRKMKLADQDLADRNALRGIYSQSINPETGEVNNAKLTKGLAGIGRGDLVPAVQLQGAQTKKAVTEANAADFELHGKRMDRAIRDLANVQSPADALSLLDEYEKTGDIAGPLANGIRTKLSADPASFGSIRTNLLRSMLTAKEELDSQLSERKAAEDERHNKATEGLTREGQQITMRGQDISAATSRRGQDIGRAEITPAKVVGPILDKINKGISLTAGEANAWNQYKSLGMVDQYMGLGATPGQGAAPTVQYGQTQPGPLSRNAFNPAPAAPPARPAPPRAPATQAPATKQAPASSVPIGQTATNPKTGQRIRWDGTSWKPVK